ncbi:hypothetical protein UlMin_004144 [Ulmus minor]
MKERKEGERSNSMKTEFVKMYKHEEFGVKLKILRPELREMEEKETETRIDGISFKDLRESLVKLKLSEDDKSKNSSSKHDMLGHLGRTPTFMMQPPKEELVEKFHIDNDFLMKQILNLKTKSVPYLSRMSFIILMLGFIYSADWYEFWIPIVFQKNVGHVKVRR